MQFEQLRRAVQMIHLKPITDSEGTPYGIAGFEATVEEYEAARGVWCETDWVRKSDLLRPPKAADSSICQGPSRVRAS